MPTELPERRPDSVPVPSDRPSGDQPFGGPVAPVGPDAVDGQELPDPKGPGSMPDLVPGTPAPFPAGGSF